MIGQNVDSPAAGQYAQSKGLPWVGYNSDSRKFAPTSWLVAAVYDWGPYYLKRVRAAANGTWKTGSYWGSMKDGFALLSPYGPKVSAKTKALIAKKRPRSSPARSTSSRGRCTTRAASSACRRGSG